MGPAPIPRTKIIKKRTKKFVRFESDRVHRVKPSWRKPKGIDCRVRRKFKGTRLMPKIGYGSNKKTKYLLPCGFYKITIANPKDLSMLLMLNRKYAVEIADGVSVKKRKEITDRCASLNLKVLNKSSKFMAAETV